MIFRFKITDFFLKCQGLLLFQYLLHPQFIIKITFHFMDFDGRLKNQTVSVVFKKKFLPSVNCQLPTSAL